MVIIALQGEIWIVGSIVDLYALGTGELIQMH